MARLPLPAATLHILKGGLHPHAPAVLLDAFAPGRPIRNQKPGLLVAFVPHRTELCLERMLLPQPHRAKPRLAGTRYDLRPALPPLKVAVALALAVLVLVDAQDIVPAVDLAEFNECEATQAAISDQGAVGFP